MDKEEKLLKFRYLYWRRGWVEQHTVSSLKKSLEGLFSFSSIRHGEIKKGQGDIVIINLKPKQDFISLKDYLCHTRSIEKIETDGIYTNIFWGRKFFAESLNYICGTNY